MIVGADETFSTTNSNNNPEWCANLKGDYLQNNIEMLSTSTLVCWAFQIARGMEYLSSRRVLHGDLAARNVLLADNNIVKICDFGFAKSIYNNPEYRKSGDVSKKFSDYMHLCVRACKREQKEKHFRFPFSGSRTC